MNKFVPVLVFALVASLGLSMTTVVYNAEKEMQFRRFELAANQAVVNIQQRLNEHVALLHATSSLLRTNIDGPIDGKSFRRFISALDIQNEHAGVQGIGYAKFIKTGEEQFSEEMLFKNYELVREVWPKTDQDNRGAIILLEPYDERNKAALGFDMYQDPSRRSAMRRALQSGNIAATAPIKLVQEITPQKQSGFILYLPFGRADTSIVVEDDVEGFVFAPFRAGDLHLSVTENENFAKVALKTTDNGDLLYQAANFSPENANLNVTREIDVGGRIWEIQLHETAEFYTEFPHLSSLILGALSGVLAFSLAIAAVAQRNAMLQAHEVKRIVEETLKQKEMMLQEMRHRIKNSITRVLAIARQTASNSEDIAEFQKSFTARLHAMATSQDMLTRSKWARADLEQLLSSELKQVFGDESEHYQLKGEKVELNEKATQAIGLACHELATNALKYGGVADPGGRLDVSWQIYKKKKDKLIRLFWEESSPHAQKPTANKGFGTKLIDANIKGELGGEVIRTFTESGFHAEIVIPMDGST